MKFIVLLRHGIAEDKSANKPDEKRELTEEGRRKMKEIARSLARIFPEAEAIYSSPLVRAVQTAEPVAKEYKLSINQTPALTPKGTPADFRRLLQEIKDEFAIFVGHEPNLSNIMLDLTKMRGDIELKKGGCYGIDFEEGGKLAWMLSPRVLRASS
ncbi:MAG TPA: phosphohistidine phosphatase SixA [Thermoanaerobaculia bacterium]|jgi:phosphohistidine phosphatase